LIIHPINQQKRSVFVPLATTEGALVASVNRGMKAITESGGAIIDTHNVGSTRGPVFAVKDLQSGREVEEFILGHKPELSKIAATTSSHLNLSEIVCNRLGRRLYVRFAYDTGDAMGMNMVTIATQSLIEYISEKTQTTCIAVAGNFDVDKKPAWINVIRGRGYQVWAEAVIPEQVLQSVLKVTAKSLYDVWLSKCMIGSALAGSMAYNCHFTNVAAAIFIATGQDPAHTVEAGLGFTIVEIDGSDAVVSIYLPDVMVGTVGGGTRLAAQREMLGLMGIAGGDDGHHRQILSEIIGGAVLAGEISLLSSLAEGSLARSHQRLARGKAGV